MTNNNSNATASVGIPVFSIAFMALFVLKVAGLAGASWGLANLSWFWVFFPVILGFAFTFIVLFIVFIVALVASR